MGECHTFPGQHEWLAGAGVEVVLLDDPRCRALMAEFVRASPELWHEDIGED